MAEKLTPKFIVNRPGEDEGTLSEIGEGIVSGFIGIGQGIGELGASFIDLIGDTDYASDVTESANELREKLGVDPEGIAGTTAEVLTQFLVPGLGAAGAVSKVSKLGKAAASFDKMQRTAKVSPSAKKLTKKQQEAMAKAGYGGLTRSQKVALGAQQVAAAGLADALVATDNIRTIGDFFEGGPTQTDQAVGLEGREEAARRILNKIKIGAEAGGLTATIPKALGLTGTAVGAGVKGVASTEAAKVVGKGVKAGAGKVSGYLKGLEEARILEDISYAENPLKTLVADTASVLRYRGYLPEEVAEARSVIPGMTEGQINLANATIKKLDNSFKLYEKGLKKTGHRLTADKKAEMYDTVFEYLIRGVDDVDKGSELLSRLPKEVVPYVQRMRSHVTNLSRTMLDTDYLKTRPQQVADEIKQTIESKLNSYMRRKYEIFERRSFEPTPEMKNIGKEGFKKDKSSLLSELKRMERKSPNSMNKFLTEDETGKIVLRELLDDSQLDEAAELATENFIKRYQPKNVPRSDAARSVRDSLNTGLFVERSRLRGFQRRLLGEIQDPKEAYIGTVSDLAEFRAIDQFYGTLRNLVQTNSGVGKFFKSPEDIVAESGIKLGDDAGVEALLKATDNAAAERGLVRLTDEGFGSMQNFYVPQTIYKDLTKFNLQQNGVVGTAARAAYSGFLQLKGISQFSKTVLSPVTQIRNVTTASLFALAQGNVGRGVDLGESIRTVYKGMSDDVLAKELLEAQELGILGAQAELREAQELIRSGFGFQAPTKIDGYDVGPGFSQAINEGGLGAFLHSAGKKISGAVKPAQDAYRGGDDIWKLYNFKFEQNKLKNAFSRNREEVQTYLQQKGRLASGEGVSISDDMIERAIKEEAADIVRNTVPNYNLAPEVIRELRKAPLGNFIAFPYEILRTGANTISRGVDELASDSAAIREIGLRRLTGAATTFAAIPATVSALAYSTSGVTKEEMDAYKRSFAPPWERNARLIPLGRDENGDITYINYSYSNPYDSLERMVNSAINKAQEGRELGKGSAQIVAEAGFESIRETLSPFLSPSIMTEKLLDVLPAQTGFGRGGRTATGARVYNPEESVGDQIGKGFVHILDGVLPGAFPLDVKGGEFQASRFARGVLGETQLGDALGISPTDRRGIDYDLSAEIMRSVTGITELTAKTDQSLEYRGYEFGRARTAASNIFNKEANSANATPEGLYDAFVKADEARYRIYNDFYQVVEDLRTMGKSDAEIYTVLKQAKVGDFQMIMANMYNPLKVSDNTFDSMIRKGNIDALPLSEISSYRSQRMGIPFKASEPIEDLGVSSEIEPLRQPLSSPSAPEVAPQPTAIRPQSQQIPAQIPQVAPLTDNTKFFLPSATGGVFGKDRGVEYQSIVQTAEARGITPDELIQKAGLQRADVSASLLPDPRDRDLANRG